MNYQSRERNWVRRWEMKNLSTINGNISWKKIIRGWMFEKEININIEIDEWIWHAVFLNWRRDNVNDGSTSRPYSNCSKNKNDNGKEVIKKRSRRSWLRKHCGYIRGKQRRISRDSLPHIPIWDMKDMRQKKRSSSSSSRWMRLDFHPLIHGTFFFLSSSFRPLFLYIFIAQNDRYYFISFVYSSLSLFDVSIGRYETMGHKWGKPSKMNQDNQVSLQQQMILRENNSSGKMKDER